MTYLDTLIDDIIIYGYFYASTCTYVLITCKVLYYSFSRTKLFWLSMTCRITYGHSLRLNCDNGHVYPCTEQDESLIIIIHKIFLWESARRETKQERCAANKRGGTIASSGLAYVLLIPSGRELEYSTTGRGCARVSRAETQSLPASAPIRAPRRWRRLTYALPLRVSLILPPFLPGCSYLILYWTYYPLGLRPTSKQTADLLFGKRSHGSFFNAANDVLRIFFLFTGFFRFYSLIFRTSCSSLFLDCCKDSELHQDNLLLLHRVYHM